MTDAKFITV